MQLDEGEHDRHIRLAVRLKREVVVSLCEVEVARHAYPVLVHPAQVPHRERTHVCVRRGLVVAGGLFEPNGLGLIGDSQPMVIVVADLDERVDVSLCR